MTTTALHLVRGLFLAAVLCFLTSALDAQAGPAKPAKVKPMKMKPMKVKQCMDHATAGHKHARKKETSLKGQPLLQTVCQILDFGFGPTNVCSTTTNTYGKKKLLVSSQSEGGLPAFYSYDKKDNLIGATFQFLADTNLDGVVDSVVQQVYALTYDKWGNRLTLTLDGVLIETNSYDNFNNPLATWFIQDFDNDGVANYLFSAVYTNTYDCNGNLTNQVECSVTVFAGGTNIFGGVTNIFVGSTNISKFQRAYTYDSKGRVLTLDASDPALGGMGGRFLATYSYDKKGNLLNIASIHDANGNGMLDPGEGGELTTRTYDKEGRLILEQHEGDFDGDGMVDPLFGFTIQYVY